MEETHILKISRTKSKLGNEMKNAKNISLLANSVKLCGNIVVVDLVQKQCHMQRCASRGVTTLHTGILNSIWMILGVRHCGKP